MPAWPLAPVVSAVAAAFAGAASKTQPSPGVVSVESKASTALFTFKVPVQPAVAMSLRILRQLGVVGGEVVGCRHRARDLGQASSIRTVTPTPMTRVPASLSLLASGMAAVREAATLALPSWPVPPVAVGPVLAVVQRVCAKERGHPIGEEDDAVVARGGHNVQTLLPVGAAQPRSWRRRGGPGHRCCRNAGGTLRGSQRGGGQFLLWQRWQSCRRPWWLPVPCRAATAAVLAALTCGHRRIAHGGGHVKDHGQVQATFLRKFRVGLTRWRGRGCIWSSGWCWQVRAKRLRPWCRPRQGPPLRRRFGSPPKICSSSCVAIIFHLMPTAFPVESLSESAIDGNS